MRRASTGRGTAGSRSASTSRRWPARRALRHRRAARRRRSARARRAAGSASARRAASRRRRRGVGRDVHEGIEDASDDCRADRIQYMSRLAAPAARGCARAGAARARRSLRSPPRCRARRTRRASTTTVVDARDALRRHDRNRLAALRAAGRGRAQPARDVGRLLGADEPHRRGRSRPSSTPFAQRWSGTYVEDRLRNDWLLELGRRRDWRHLRRRVPALSHERRPRGHLLRAAHRPARRQGRARGRRSPPGWRRRTPTTAAPCSPRRCSTPKQLSAGRHLEEGAPRASRRAGRAPRARRRRWSVRQRRQRRRRDRRQPGALPRARRPATATRTDAELTTLALTRLAASDRDAGRRRCSTTAGSARCRPTWRRGPGRASRGRRAIKLQPEAADQFLRADARRRQERSRDRAARRHARLEGARRAARRQRPRAAGSRWCRRSTRCRRASRTTPAWVYWKARGAAGAGARLAGRRGAARAAAASCSPASPAQLNFYGALAAEDLGQPLDAAAAAGAADAPPSATRPRPIPASRAALQLIAIGLRSEGVREWNYSIRGLGDRELLAAAQLACDREVWDRCINTSDRTRAEIDIEQRFPMPFRKEVVGAGARDRPRPGLRLRPDPPGVALHHRRALGRRRLRA